MLIKKIYFLITDKSHRPIAFRFRRKPFSVLLTGLFTLAIIFTASLSLNLYFFIRARRMESDILAIKKSLIQDYFEKNLMNKDFVEAPTQKNKALASPLTDAENSELFKFPMRVNRHKITQDSSSLTYDFVLESAYTQKKSIRGSLCAIFYLKDKNSEETQKYYAPDNTKENYIRQCPQNILVKFNHFRPTTLSVKGQLENLTVDHIDLYFQPNNKKANYLIDSYQGKS